MDTTYLDKATFSAVYHFLQNRHDSAVAKCFRDLFRISLLFFPAFVCPDVAVVTGLATGASLAGIGAGKAVSDATQNAFSLFKNKSYEDYYTRYEQMQIAQVMLLYASYFDAISKCLPNENGEIEISSEVRWKLSQDALAQYCQELESSVQEQGNLHRLLSEEIALPDPTEGFTRYERRLSSFYNQLNEQFIKFFEKLPFWEGLNSDNEPLNQEQKDFFRKQIQKLPEEAVIVYRKQYFTLANTFPDFFIWSNQKEHRWLERQIDVGFCHMAELLRQNHSFAEQAKNDATDTMERYRVKYANYLQGPIIDHSAGFDTDGVVFPTKKDIFIPQSFQALTYHNNMSLEQKSTWKNTLSGEEIGNHIRSVLSHPTCGQRPLLILGHPGAGKTLLCYMLAAQILSAEYHVIIIRLRDVVAGDDITHQIDSQIARDLGDGCRWCDIRRANLNKPILLIFDGYDELLQASGKTHSNYLNDIANFQSNQFTIYHIFVRCIVTSRETLIDKASIPEASQVLRLCDFDNIRIQAWIKIWNQSNEDFFSRHKLSKLEIASTGKIKELASQPLLLLMLALYEINGNPLQEQTNINRTELYYKLIYSFIIREKEKDTNFFQLTAQKRKNILYESFCRLGIAALGMYNRRKLVIRTVELEKDLAFLSHGKTQLDPTDAYALEEGDKLVGSFFFIHNSESTVRTDRIAVKVSAYEFLHNTFGEFLTAYYILDVVFRSVRRQLSETEFGEPFSWPTGLLQEWHIGLAYTPLFTRPVVLNMIHELAPLLAKERGLQKDAIYNALNGLFSEEIKHLITGELFECLNKTLSTQGNPFEHPELTVHVAIYSVNLILLRATVCTSSFIFNEQLGSEHDWHKLTQLWRYAFSEEELVSLSCLLRLENSNGIYQLSYQYDEEATKRVDSMSKLVRMSRITEVLGEDAAKAVFGLFTNSFNPQIYSIIAEEQLSLKTQYTLHKLFLDMQTSNFQKRDELIQNLELLFQYSNEENNLLGLHVYCCLVEIFAKQHLLERTDIPALLHVELIQRLYQVLQSGSANLYKKAYMLMISQKILDCISYACSYINILNFDDSLQYMIRYLNYLGRGSFRKSELLTQISQEQAKKIIILYCQSITAMLQDTHEVDIKKACYCLRRIFKPRGGCITWQEISPVLQICEKLQQKGKGDLADSILNAYLQTIRIKFPDQDYFDHLHQKFDYFICAIDYYYYLEQTQDNRSVKINYNQAFPAILCNIDSLSIFLPSHEQSLFRYLCLISECTNAISLLRFDLSADLQQILVRYGYRLNIQTIRKIMECARQFKYHDLEDTVVQMILK